VRWKVNGIEKYYKIFKVLPSGKDKLWRRHEEDQYRRMKFPIALASYIFLLS